MSLCHGQSSSVAAMISAGAELVDSGHKYIINKTMIRLPPIKVECL